MNTTKNIIKTAVVSPVDNTNISLSRMSMIEEGSKHEIVKSTKFSHFKNASLKLMKQRQNDDVTCG
jgi:hypothetical protein